MSLIKIGVSSVCANGDRTTDFVLHRSESFKKNSRIDTKHSKKISMNEVSFERASEDVAVRKYACSRRSILLTCERQQGKREFIMDDDKSRTIHSLINAPLGYLLLASIAGMILNTK